MGGSGSNMLTPPITTLRDLALALDIPSAAWRIDEENHTVLVHLGQLGGKPGMTLAFELADDEEGTWNHEVYQVVRFGGDLSDIENWFEEPHGSKVVSPWATVNALTAETAKAILDAALSKSKGKRKGKAAKGGGPKPAPTQQELAQLYADLAEHIRKVGPLDAGQLKDYERKHWLTKYRPEKRDEPNRLFHFMFRSPLVRSYSVTNKRDDEPWKRHHFSSTMFRVVGQRPVAPDGAWLSGRNEPDKPVPADRGKSLPEAAKSEATRKPRFAVKPETEAKKKARKKSGASKKCPGEAKTKAGKKLETSKKDSLPKGELEKLERSLGLGAKRR